MDRWFNFDIDYLNGLNDPIKTIDKILSNIDPSTKSAIVIQHHRVLGHLKKAVSEGILNTPFIIDHVDEHHDFYHFTNNRILDCGNFMHRIPKKWYTKLIWYQNYNSYIAKDHWGRVIVNLTKNLIEVKETERSVLCLKKWKDIKLATFCVSPDYCDTFLHGDIDVIINKIVKHFNLSFTIKRTDKNRYRPQSWTPCKIVRPGLVRPTKMKDVFAYV